MPSNSIDPIVCGASVVQNLQHIVSRNSDPKETLVVTVASLIREMQIMLFLKVLNFQVQSDITII